MPTLPDDLAQYLATDDGRAAQPLERTELVRLRLGLGYPLDLETYTALHAAFRKAARTTALASAEHS